MVTFSPTYDASACERDAGTLWKSRHLPAADGTIGTGAGGRIWQFEGSFAPGDRDENVLQRAVAADIDARYLALAGRRAIGTLRRERFRLADTERTVGPLLASLGIWTGGTGGRPYDTADRPDVAQRIVGRLASRGLLVLREVPLRVCPSCATPRSPERLVYRDELGPTVLVRFAVTVHGREVHALVWVDAPWRLLGTCALVVHPDLPYVVARYARKGVEELVLTSRSSIDRLSAWLPGSELEPKEELAGRELVGLGYGYPLRHEFPMGGALEMPAGTVQASTEVDDTGTGIVPLVPGHGGTDAQLAERLGLPGWPLVTIRGRLDPLLLHKYAGLDLPTTDEFITRDLTESGAVFAELKVRRGVPHCAICGTATVWIPTRAWCLEPARLPPALAAEYARLLPRSPPLQQLEIAAWPVSESTLSTDGTGWALRECNRCDRLAPPDGPETCPCGGRTRLVRRNPLPAIAGAIDAWARQDPMPPNDQIRLYLGTRRRAPALVHLLAAIAGLDGPVGELGLTLVPTAPTEELAPLIGHFGADTVRAALARGGARAASLGERCVEERRRIERWWRIAADVLVRCDAAMLATFARPIGASLAELEPIDRALVARWERVRIRALAEYDRWMAPLAYREIARFWDSDLSFYLGVVEERLRLAGSPPSKRAALRTLVHVLRGSTVLLAPVVPHVAEAIHRAVAPDRSSVFEEPPVGVDRALADDARTQAWGRWRSVVRAVRRFRAQYGLAPGTRLPRVALVLGTDEAADLYRADAAVLAPLSGVERIEVGSPRDPWSGRRREVRPIESEVQRAYPAQASQMLALLRRLPPRRLGDGGTDLNVVVGSHTYRISPAMVDMVDILPERMRPAPWAFGEMYVELPVGADERTRGPPPLSVDAYWIVRRVQRAIQRRPAPAGAAPGVVIIGAAEPLAGELLSAREAIGHYLGLEELRVVPSADASGPGGRSTGRTRTGAGWWFSVSGSPPTLRPSKQRRPRPRVERVPAPGPLPSTPEEDFADDAHVATAESIRNLGLELDAVLGAPLLGPAKVAGAWHAGLHSVREFADAPYDTLAALPGFGRPIATALHRGLGRDVPPPPHRPDRPVHRIPRSAPIGRPSSPRPAAARTAEPAGLTVPAPVEPSVEAPPPPSEPIAGSVPAAAAQAEPAGAAESPASAPVELPPTPAATEPAVTPEVTAPVAEVPSRWSDEAEEVPDEGPPVPAPELEPVGSAAPPEGPALPLPEAAPVEEPTASVPEAAPVEEPTASVPEAAPAEPPAALGPDAPPVVDVAPQTDEPPSAEAATVVPTAEAEPTVPPRTPSESSVSTPGNSDASVGLEPGAPAEPPSTLEAEPAGPSPSRATAAVPAVEPTDRAVAPEPPATSTAPEEPPVPPATEPPEGVAGRSDSAGEVPTDGRTTELPAEPMVPPDSPPEDAAPEPRSSAPAVAPAASSSEAGEEPSPEAGRVEDGSTLPVPPPILERDALPEPKPAAAERGAAEPSSVGGVGPEAPPEEPPSLAEEVEDLPEDAPGGTDAGPADAVPPPDQADEPAGEPGPVGPSAPVAPEPPISVEPVAAATGALETAPAPPAPDAAAPTPLLAPPVAPVPAPPAPPAGIELVPGRSYQPALERFLDATAAGHRGLCVVRDSPERIRAHVGARPVTILWLSNLGGKSSVKPNDLDGLARTLARALSEEHTTAFFLEGLEYLVRLHGVDKLLDRLGEFDTAARAADARVWVPLNPDLLSTGDLERFSARFPAG